MKVRMLGVIAILSLAAWLPIQAQQAAAPAPGQQAPAPAPKQDDSKAAPAKHECCCAAKANAVEGHDHQAMDCCHGKSGDAAKADCCAGKSEKDMACCAKTEKADKAAMQCCAGMKDGKCAAKDGKSCCRGMNAKDETGCCTGMKEGQCPVHANGN